MANAGAALLVRLKTLGIDHLFVNSGTDFPPVIEGYAQARSGDGTLPEAVIVPHEHVALGMAHGHHLVSGQPQAVMLHTNVGLANGTIGAINAWCDQIPLLLMSGRTPVTEQGRFGARTVPIGWGQEMYDQHGLVREMTKWDYELRFPEQVTDLLDRAVAIACSTPRGPVYLSLPREVLTEEVPDSHDAPVQMHPAQVAAPQDALARAAEWLAGAERPLIISQRGAGSEAGFDALGRLAEAWAIPVLQYFPNMLSIASDNPMSVGTDPHPWLSDADVILCINALAPWSPDRAGPGADARVIQLGPDPLFQRTPVRNFPAHMALPGETADTLLSLISHMDTRVPEPSAVERRLAHVAAEKAARSTQVVAQAEAGNGGPMSKEWVSLCLGKAIRGRRASVFHELGCPLEPMGLQDHGSYFQEPYSGGLGWGLPAAMGGQLADPDRLVFATIGDGSYMFANPTACHQVAESLGLPVIVLVLNNGEWGAVRHSVEGMYPEGEAVRANEVPLTGLSPSPNFTLTARASRAHAERITDGADLPAALERAIDIATTERRQVLLDIAIAPVTHI